jgi:DNA-binding response OmpR family regulator
MNENIAIVDDENDILELVSLHLQNNGFKPHKYKDATSFLKSIRLKVPKLIILDIMLPDMSGTDICKNLKSDNDLKSIPIIMLTAKHDEIDKVVGLEVGADDYITKPFSPKELIARVKAVLRRVNEISDENTSKSPQIGIINIDDEIFIDMNRFTVINKENKEILLTNTELKILTVLLNKRGWVYSRDKLLTEIWGEGKYVIDRTIDVHIKHLREKLGETGKLIKNVRGVGYKIEEINK